MKYLTVPVAATYAAATTSTISKKGYGENGENTKRSSLEKT
jgi:hypothetical protein